MRIIHSTLLVLVVVAVTVAAQQPAPGTPAAPARPAPVTPAAPAPGAPGGGPQRRAPVQVMTVTSTAWADGGMIPKKYTQAGEQVSPALAWSNVPDDAQSFVLMARDIDVITNNGDDMLHWMLWNIPAATRSLPEGVPQGPQLPDGTRQISVSGPYYRGPGAPSAGPAHHYIFELYAIDGPINVPAVGQSPAQTRAAVLAAMANRVRGKGVYVGLFKR